MQHLYKECELLIGQQLLTELGKRGLFWRHDGDPSRPHAVLSSGKHATGFVNIRETLTDPVLGEGLAHELIAELDGEIDLSRVTLVVGSGYASVFLVSDVARILSSRFARVVRRTFTDKVKQNGDEMEFKFDLRSDDVPILIEDMQTSGHTTAASMKALRARNPNIEILPVAGCVFTWNEAPEHLRGVSLVPLAKSQMQTWDLEKELCGLCKEGSEPIKPKAPGNWKRLTEG